MYVGSGWLAGGRRAQTDIWPCCVQCRLRLEQKKDITLDKIDSDIECECVGVVRLVSRHLSYILSEVKQCQKSIYYSQQKCIVMC